MKRVFAPRWPSRWAIALMLGFVAAPVSSASESKKAKPVTILTEQSNRTATIGVGTPIEIRLQSQPGTGFSWIASRSTAGLSPMEPLRSPRAMPGSAQIQRFRFSAKRRGTYRLSFSYDQPWRAGIKGARIKSFTIIVR